MNADCETNIVIHLEHPLANFNRFVCYQAGKIIQTTAFNESVDEMRQKVMFMNVQITNTG